MSAPFVASKPDRDFLAQTERDFQKWVRLVAERGGWSLSAHFGDSRKQIRTPDGRLILIGDKQAKGFPDWVFLHPRQRRIVFVELKNNKRKPTTEQQTWLDNLQACGLDARFWRPRDRDEILDTFLARPALSGTIGSDG